jgi:hypothetical protein
MKEVFDDETDELEAAMQDCAPVNCPLTHTFTPGMYSRTIFMPAGTLITSLVHRTEHQFIISAGIALVKIRAGEWERLAAPHIGITKPKTRRILYIEQDCLWTTFHRVDISPKDDSEESISEAVRLIENEIIEPHENKLLGGVIKNNVITKTIDNAFDNKSYSEINR